VNAVLHTVSYIVFNRRSQDKKREPEVRFPFSRKSLRHVVGSGPHSEFPIRWASMDRFRQFPRNGAAHHDRNSYPFNELFRRGFSNLTGRAERQTVAVCCLYSILALRINQAAFLSGRVVFLFASLFDQLSLTYCNFARLTYNAPSTAF
jgi:hypothetical protein